MWKVPLFKIFNDSDDFTGIKSVISRGNFWATGPEIEKFERKLAKYIGTKFAVTYNSGTSALHAILLALDMKKGSNVAVPSFTFISTANSALFVGANPVFVDIEEETLGMDPIALEKTIKQKKIDMIIPVHYAGHPCKINEIIKIARKNKIPVIEDAAEALGSTLNRKKIGSFGDAAMLSFAQNKIITTGEGGAIVTNDEKIYKKLLLIRSHGRDDNSKYFSTSGRSDYIEIGYNFRMSSISAALGIAQLTKINKIIKMRKKIVEIYHKGLSDIDGIELPPLDTSHVFQLFSIRVKNKKQNKLAKALNQGGIMTKVYFDPIHLTPFYKRKFNSKKIELPVTKKVSSEILSLPIYPHMNNKEINLVISEVRKFFGKQ